MDVDVDVDVVPVKPLLRGWFHLVCFFLAIPTAVLVIAMADGVRARVGAVVYAVGLVGLFGVSGLYHRLRWSPRWLARMRRLDHSAIFVMIAGSYTPLCLLVLDGWLRWAMLVTAWTGAVGGAVLAWTPGPRTRVARSALYIVLGWVACIAAPQWVRNLSVAELVLIAVGGVLFTLGAITLATRWPNPSPRVFGYHEVWHVMVVAAAVCHFLAIRSLVHGTA